jgi:CubicO group peptidase (beta-lactamase class C family)
MNRKRHVLLSWTLVLVAAVSVRADDIDDYLKRAMEDQHLPAVSIAVIKNGAVTKVAGYGLADIEHGIPARPDTVYKIGSVSKQFIATGIMLLVQDGRIAVDDKVGKYVEGTPSTWQAITLRHLLTHTSGLMREGPGFDPNKIQPDIDVIKTAYPVPLMFKPGEKHVYSNLGYFVLAEVIQKVSGKAWSDFLAERVFAPLGMTATRMTGAADIVPNRSDGYAWNKDKFQNAPNWPAVRPSGAFLSTVLDLAKWEAALITDQVLKASTKKEMWTPVTLNDGSKYPYGFGWQLNDWPADSPAPIGVPMISHGGSMPGFRAGYTRWPSYGLSVIVLTNREGANVEGLGANIAIRVQPELKTVSAAQAAPAPR